MATTLFQTLADALEPRYGAGEANSIARIVWEDAFGTKNYRFEPAGQQWAELERIKTALLLGEPVQYVLGRADFFGLTFKVSPAVLIPRQETEELVALAIEKMKKHTPAPRILDIGVGSGCIGITLLRRLPNAVLYGIDKSPAALDVAQYNAEQLLADPSRAHFSVADVLHPAYEPPTGLDLVISNPPYIPRHETALMPEHVLAHEPELALFVEDADPLVFYRVIAILAKKSLKKGGWLLFECNQYNATAVLELVRELGYCELSLHKDLSGADRMVAAMY